MTNKQLCKKCKVNKKAPTRYLCYDCINEWDRERRSIASKTNRLKKLLIKERGEKCERCGKSGKVIGHHRVHVVDGGDTSRENIELVCKACHDKEHSTRKRMWG